MRSRRTRWPGVPAEQGVACSFLHHRNARAERARLNRAVIHRLAIGRRYGERARIRRADAIDELRNAACRRAVDHDAVVAHVGIREVPARTRQTDRRAPRWRWR